MATTRARSRRPRSRPARAAGDSGPAPASSLPSPRGQARARRPRRRGRSCATPGRRAARARPPSSRLRADEVVALRVPPDGRCEPAGSIARARRRGALEGEQRGPDEELEADERRDGVPGQPEHERPAANAERDRLARLDRDAPEHLLDAELGLDPANEVVRADGDPAGGDEDVASRPRSSACDAPPRCPRPASRSTTAPRRRARGQHQAVRLVDLARRERLAGRAELGPGGQHGDARAPRACDLGDPCRGERADLRGAETGPPRHDVAGADVAADGARARRARRSGISTCCLFDNISIGTTASAPSGTTPPVAIAIASPGASARSAGRPAAMRTRPAGAPACRRRAPRTRPSPSSGTAAGRRGRARPRRAPGRRRRRAARLRGSGRTRAEDGASASSIVSRRHRTHKLAAVISVVVPVHDEEQSVGSSTTSSPRRSTRSASAWEVVFVDDGSTDGTFAALTRLHAAHDDVRVVRLRRNFGKAAALQAGFAEAQGDDRRHDRRRPAGRPRRDPAPARQARRGLRPRLRLEDEAARPAQPPRSRRGSSTPSPGRLSGLRLHDMNCGLKAYRAEVVRGLRIYGELHRFIPVLAHYRGLPRRRAARQPPAARARPLALRHGALRARLPRPADRHLHGPLPAPAAAPLRRPRPAARRHRHARPRLPDRAQAHGRGDRPPAAAHARRPARRRRHPALLARPRQRARREPPRGARRRAERRACTWTRSCAEHPLRSPLLRDVRARLPAERAGDLVPARGRRRRGRAPRERLGGRRHKWSLGPGAARAARPAPRRGSSPAAAASASTSSSSATPATSTCPRPRRLAGGRPVVFNPLVSLHDTLVDDRGRFGPGSPRRARPPPDRPHRAQPRRPRRRRHGGERALPRRARRAAARSASPSASSAPRSGSSAPAGSRRRVPRALRRQADPAARARDDPRRRAARPGAPVPRRRQRPARARCSTSGPPNVDWIQWVEYEQLPDELQRGRLRARRLRDVGKAARVIPNKAFQALACGTPLVTADTPAARELLVRRRERAARPARRSGGARGCACGGSRTIPRSRARLGDGGLAAYRAQASEDVLGAAGVGCSSGCSPRDRRAAALLWAATAAFAAGFGAPPCSATGPSRPAASTSATWRRRSGRPRTATSSRVTDLHGEQISRLGAHFDPMLAAARAALVALARPGAAARRPGRRGRPRRAAASSGSRASTSARSWPAARARARLPALPAGAVADRERLPPRRARVPAPALRVLVPRRGPALPFALSRRRRSRRRSTSGSPSRRWASGTRVRHRGAPDRGAGSR